MKSNKLLVLLLLLGQLGMACAQTITLRSGPQQVHLLELYTSEGCSSCPPADDWLRDLKSDPRLWREVVPVAFHVDYWNYLGWPDRFATQANSQRQRQLARAGGFQVYTPGFMLDGAEWRGGLSRRRLELGEPVQAGELTVEWRQSEASILFSNLPLPAPEEIMVHVVMLGFDRQSHVRAGENFGRLLRHDFVALSHQIYPMRREDGQYLASVPLEDIGAGAVAVWTSARGHPAPMQTVGGWLDFK